MPYSRFRIERHLETEIVAESHEDAEALADLMLADEFDVIETTVWWAE